MPAYDEIANKQNQLIRKVLNMSVFRAPSSAAAIDAITGSDSLLLAPPVDYLDVGHISRDGGANFAREVETSDITSVGSVEPTRRDLTSDVTTVQFRMQETKAPTLGIYTGVDTSQVNPTESGEVVLTKPPRPTQNFHRILALGVDGSGDTAVYMARFLPRASVTEYGEQAWNDGEDEALSYQVTMTGYKDDALGFSERWYFGGPGWAAQLEAMGFAGAAGSAVTLTAIDPTSGAAAGGDTVTLTGTGFTSGATVTFGGAAATNVNAASATEITCTTPAGTAGTVDVSVTSGGVTDTLAGAFTYA